MPQSFWQFDTRVMWQYPPWLFKPVGDKKSRLYFFLFIYLFIYFLFFFIDTSKKKLRTFEYNKLLYYYNKSS